MIAHFVTDEKIIDQLIQNFFKISKDHLFIVFIEGKTKEFKYINEVDEKIVRFDFKKKKIAQILGDNINALEGIILHSLNNIFIDALMEITKPVKIAWIEWGFEIYQLPKIRPKLYGPKTFEYLKKKVYFLKLKWWIKENKFFRIFFSLIKKGKIDLTTKTLLAINRVDYFCSYIKEDFDYLLKYYEFSKLKYLEITFSTIDQYLANSTNLKTNQDENNILIGNSNTLESNYLDVIDKLVKYKDFDKVYIILSYGYDDHHKNKIINTGNSLLKEKFRPITNFMDRSKYVELLHRCPVGIFNHYRQQAMGNIIAMLYMGSRVYLSKMNPAYSFFIRNGIFIYSFEEEFDKFKTKKLSLSEIKNNRKIIENIFNQKKVISDLKSLINRLKYD